MREMKELGKRSAAAREVFSLEKMWLREGVKKRGMEPRRKGSSKKKRKKREGEGIEMLEARRRGTVKGGR